jgi:3-keto steroid reductase
LTQLLSVRRLARHLNATVPYLNAVICNAGISGWIGIDWPKAIWTVLTDLVQSVTFPQFKLSGTGFLTGRQLPSSNENKEKEEPASGKAIPNGPANKAKQQDDEPPLGEVFTANLFGHYMLSHWLMPLLSSEKLSEGHEGRVILVSSIEAATSHFSLEDPQSLLANESYESSKRMTDILALTSRLPSTQTWVSSFLSPASSPSLPNSKSNPASTSTITGVPPKIYVTHPGVCATAIVTLPWILNLAMIAAMYLARLFGSPWHPTSSYLGATAPVWLALADQSTLDNFETPRPSDSNTPSKSDKGAATTRTIKWGSSTDWKGQESVKPTEVEGWGFMGLPSDAVERKKGRRRGAKPASKEEREAFEETGRGVWRYMEGLRESWEERLAGVDDA